MKTSLAGGLAVHGRVRGETRRKAPLGGVTHTWANAVALHRRAPVGKPLRVADVHRLRAVVAVAEAGVEGCWEGDDELARMLHRVQQLHAW